MMISQYCYDNSSGFALIELLMVFVIIGALASIAIPHYAEYREKALAAQCKANRYHIEMEENVYFAEHETPGLKIDATKYSCPCGGVYVWLVTDPEDPHYPQIGCSHHFTGSTPAPDAPAEEVSATQETPIEETTEEPAPPEEESSPVQFIEDLMGYTDDLNLTGSIEKTLLSNLDGAITSIERGKTSQAISKINQFVKTVNKNKGKNIKSEEADILISKGEQILNLLD